jgi:hypothetical protein
MLIVATLAYLVSLANAEDNPLVDHKGFGETGPKSQLESPVFKKNSWVVNFGEAPAISYDELARFLDKHKDERVCLAGMIIQEETDQDHQLTQNFLIDIGGGSILTRHTRPPSQGRFFEGDQVEFCGQTHGLFSYTAIFGNQVTVPLIWTNVMRRTGPNS